MKAATAIGIGVAFGSLLLSSMMDGTSPASFMNIPALIIIMGGTGGVTLASVGMTSMKKVPSLYKLVFSTEPPDMRAQLHIVLHEGSVVTSCSLTVLGDAWPTAIRCR